MHTMMNCYENLRSGIELSKEECQYLKSNEPKHFQLASLALQLIHKERTTDEHDVLIHIFKEIPSAFECVSYAFPDHPFIRSFEDRKQENVLADDLAYILANTSKNSVLGKEKIDRIIKSFVDDDIDLIFMAVWLMTIGYKGLSTVDLETMTISMRDTGSIFDYRGLENLRYAKVIRRYPTGALSEKVALILPSLLASVSAEFPIVSPFLVARSLGFTGGTWDKLKSIPSFIFPLPGEEAIETMKECAVAMSVTQGDFNPADRKMYQFRSITGTIPPHELIIASIASKMLALPADHLLMDVRYGNGAFLSTIEDAEKLAVSLSELICKGGVPCTYHLTDTAQPNGNSVGNSLEVLEALAVMNNKFEQEWDIRSINEQRSIVLQFFENLMERSFPGKPKGDWRELGQEMFDSGEVFESFISILTAHKVDQKVIEQIKIDPTKVIGPQNPPVLIHATTDGVLKFIDQKKLGNIVNFQLGGGGNEFVGKFDPNAGVTLHKRLGDQIQIGDLLCKVYPSAYRETTNHDSLIHELNYCFKIEEKLKPCTIEM